MGKRVCKNCVEFEKVAVNVGYCNKFKFQISMNLAQLDRVCEGMDNE